MEPQFKHLTQFLAMLSVTPAEFIAYQNAVYDGIDKVHFTWNPLSLQKYLNGKLPDDKINTVVTSVGNSVFRRIKHEKTMDDEVTKENRFIGATFLDYTVVYYNP
jgi:hypothetical protein